MTRRAFLILCVLTALTIAAASLAQLHERRGDRLKLSGERVFPALSARLSEVHSIAIKSAKAQFVLKRRENDAWVAASQHGYPVKSERVNRVLVALAELEIIAPKTARSELYRRIGVGQPDADSARSRQITLKTKSGRVLADLIAGQQRHARTGRRDSGTYIRRPGEARAYLAAGLLDLSDTIYPWLQTRIVDIAPSQIRRVAIHPRNGKRLLAIRPERGAPAMGIADLPPGARPQVEAVRELAHVLEGVRFDTVEPLEKARLAAPLAKARISTFDGLRVSVNVYRRLNAYWLTFDAAAAQEAPQSTIARAETLKARTAGWAYKVADYLGERFSQSLDSIL